MIQHPSHSAMVVAALDCAGYQFCVCYYRYVLPGLPVQQVASSGPGQIFGPAQDSRDRANPMQMGVGRKGHPCPFAELGWASPA